MTHAHPASWVPDAPAPAYGRTRLPKIPTKSGLPNRVPIAHSLEREALAELLCLAARVRPHRTIPCSREQQVLVLSDPSSVPMPSPWAPSRLPTPESRLPAFPSEI